MYPYQCVPQILQVSSHSENNRHHITYFSLLSAIFVTKQVQQVCVRVCVCVFCKQTKQQELVRIMRAQLKTNSFLRICQVCLTVTYYAFILGSGVTLQIQFEMICSNFKMTQYQCSTMGQLYYDTAGGKTQSITNVIPARKDQFDYYSSFEG